MTEGRSEGHEERRMRRGKCGGGRGKEKEERRKRRGK